MLTDLLSPEEEYELLEVAHTYEEFDAIGKQILANHPKWTSTLDENGLIDHVFSTEVE